MKKTLGALLLTLGLAVLPLHAADAAPSDSVRGPGCGDINTDTSYSTFEGQLPPTAYSGIDTVKPSCAGFTYELHVYDTAGNPLADPAIGVGDGSNSRFDLTSQPAGGPSAMCISVESRSANGRVVDQAPDSPDAECETGAYFLLDGPTGGRPMG